jgi:hypothetical protein
MDIKEIGKDGVDWLCLAENRDQWQAVVVEEPLVLWYS